MMIQMRALLWECTRFFFFSVPTFYFTIKASLLVVTPLIVLFQLFASAFSICSLLNCGGSNLLGFKILKTNVLELQFVLCWKTMIKIQSLGLGLLKVCLFVKLELSDCRIYWTKYARLDRSNHVQIYFSAEFQFSLNFT